MLILPSLVLACGFLLGGRHHLTPNKRCLACLEKLVPIEQNDVPKQETLMGDKFFETACAASTRSSHHYPGSLLWRGRLCLAVSYGVEMDYEKEALSGLLRTEEFAGCSTVYLAGSGTSSGKH